MLDCGADYTEVECHSCWPSALSSDLNGHETCGIMPVATGCTCRPQCQGEYGGGEGVTGRRSVLPQRTLRRLLGPAADPSPRPGPARPGSTAVNPAPGHLRRPSIVWPVARARPGDTGRFPIAQAAESTLADRCFCLSGSCAGQSRVCAPVLKGNRADDEVQFLVGRKSPVPAGRVGRLAPSARREPSRTLIQCRHRQSYL